jgi:septum formation protein
MDNLILASGSPRRKDLLQLAHIPFDVHPADVDETPPVDMPAIGVPAHLAEKKADAVAHLFPGKTILAADTIVLLEDDIIGKPESIEMAKIMLARLSGRKHTVITGVCILRDGKKDTFSVHTDVYFRKLTGEQISFYAETYTPLDKAGSYAIQEYIGLIGIERIEGDYYNVMGLPVGEVVKRLIG